MTDFGYHLYEAEEFSDLLAFPAIGLFVHPYAMDADEREMLLDFYQVAYAHDRSLIIVFMDAVEIPPTLVGASIYIYEWGREWIARIQDGLISCAGIRERERRDACLTMGDIEEE